VNRQDAEGAKQNNFDFIFLGAQRLGGSFI
jgi:hypothetical protein